LRLFLKPETWNSLRTIAHIINPVKADPSSDLHLAQPVTFKAMWMAREVCKASVDVRFYSAQYPEDHGCVPEGFLKTRDLDRSVLDFLKDGSGRRLPILSDILDRLYHASEAEYLIYTNVDIALMPSFYLTVDRVIESGCHAFVLNRRTISKRYTSVEDLPLMFAEVGEPHKGYDCFVFRREAFPGFDLGNVCIGAPWNGRVLLWNLALSSDGFKEFKDLHATFHIGNDRVWTDETNADYAKFNKGEAFAVLDRLEKRDGAIEKLKSLGYLRNFERDEAGRLTRPEPGPVPTRNRFLFIGGLHRSGTSVVANCLKEHPDVSGFVETGVPQDEGQFLQSLYPIAKVYGGPGVFGFHPEMHVTEASPLVSETNRRKLFAEWARHWDTSRTVLLEKSPPNLLKTRFLQAMFPDAFFLIITRHPIATSYATQKWSKTAILSLLRHWVSCHRIFFEDRLHLKKCMILRYEDFVADPQSHLDRVCDFVGLSRFKAASEVKREINKAYFERWRADRKGLSLWQRGRSVLQYRVMDRALRPFGYSLYSGRS
jgi:hypothetical protein